MATADVSLLRQ